uniref:Dipeptidase n=1 Tax=Anopheles farauti TaxID=69004 RepID=A0A182QEE2_9DIPT
MIAGAAGVAVPLALKVSSGASLAERLQVATQLLETVPLIDGHNDLPWNIRKFLHNQLNDFRFDDDLTTISPWATSPWSHTDLQRLKQGRLAAQFWGAFAPCEAQHKDAVQMTLEQIDLIKRLTERYSPHMTFCASVFDIVQAHKNRQMCSLIGVEGGHSLGVSLGVLRTFYALGVRYLTITATCHTPWADSSNADAPKYDVRHGGLTAYGKYLLCSFI